MNNNEMQKRRISEKSLFHPGGQAAFLLLFSKRESDWKPSFYFFFSNEETQFLKSTVKMSSHYVPAVEESTGRNETDSKREEYIF